VKNRLLLACGVLLSSYLSATAQTDPTRLTLTPERTSPVVLVTATSASLPREPFVQALSLDQQPSRFSFLLAAIRNRDHKLERLFQADVVKTPFIRQTRVPVFGLWNGRLQLGAFANTRYFDNTLLDPLCSDRFRRIGAPRLRAVGSRGVSLTFRLDRDAFAPRPVNTWRCLTWLLGAGPGCPL
jgi:hypothetical protein